MSADSLQVSSSVDNVKEIYGNGPWHSKSGGELQVLFNLPFDVMRTFSSDYDPAELASIPTDIRGLRSYRVTGIPRGAIGANEWHKLRRELVFATEGTVRWTCEDTAGRKKVITLDGQRGALVPPGILHTYEALTDNASLLVIANTIFIPEDPSTHDSYSAESFKELQASPI